MRPVLISTVWIFHQWMVERTTSLIACREILSSEQSIMLFDCIVGQVGVDGMYIPKKKL